MHGNMKVKYTEGYKHVYHNEANGCPTVRGQSDLWLQQLYPIPEVCIMHIFPLGN
jgi:hypothetical protein